MNIKILCFELWQFEHEMLIGILFEWLFLWKFQLQFKKEIFSFGIEQKQTRSKNNQNKKKMSFPKKMIVFSKNSV